MSFSNDIMTPEEVAQFLHKSLSWVYKNRELLGGRKVGGAVFFPTKEEIYKNIFPSETTKYTKNQTNYKNQKKRSFSQDHLDPNRHGLFDKKKGRTRL